MFQVCTGVLLHHIPRIKCIKCNIGVQLKRILLSNTEIERTITRSVSTKKPGHWNVVAYATADHYDMRSLKESLLKKGVYIPTDLPTSDSGQGSNKSMYTVAKYKVTDEDRCMFFFIEGTVVLWNVDEVEQSAILNLLKPFESQSYKKTYIKSESEMMLYKYSPESSRSFISDDIIHIASNPDKKDGASLDMYTFSNVMALSVKLGIFENLMQDYVHGIEFITEDLKLGRKMRISRHEILKKCGELFALRHSINLSTDLLDTPDFYWDREELEVLYQRTCAYYNISLRTKVLNEKLNHCIELLELVSSHLNDRHHVRLEWMIIILIMIEVGFEIIHFREH